MKKLLTKTLLLTAGLLSLSQPAMAHEKETVIKFEGDTAFSGFCKAVVLDDIRILRSSIQRSIGNVAANDRAVVRRITAEDGLKCNGSNLLEFSDEREARQVKSFLTAQR